MKILCYGDSNTYGFDPRLTAGFSDRLPARLRWTGILDQDPRFTVVNEGLNGRQFPHDAGGYAHLARLLAENADADLVTVMLGTNDLFMMHPADCRAIAARADAMFEAVPALGRMRVLLICPPLPNLRPDGFRRALSEARGLPAALAAVAAARGAEFVDAGEWGCAVYPDDVHLTEAGHALFARRLSEYLAGERE